MSRIAYVNGRYVPFHEASVHIEDRGYQFADGVYEVCEVRAGRLVDERLHMERLARSLGELRIDPPMGAAALGFVLRETVRRNRVHDGLVYLQVTRGVARRDHGFPTPAVKPGVVVVARSMDRDKLNVSAANGISVITVRDERWARVDIKSLALLPNVLARQAAKDAGAREAWLVDEDGFVTEGSSSNAWIVSEKGVLITRPSSNRILTGVTMTVVKSMLVREKIEFEERAFKVDEAYAAREAFLTAATQIVMPVVRIDGRTIGSGTPGPIAALLREKFHSASHISADLG